MDATLTGLGFDLTSGWGIFWICTAWTFLVVTLIWIIGLFQPTHSMMDGWYGFGYATAAWVAYLLTRTASPTAAAVLLMTSLHGCRLGWYLSKRWWGYRKTTGGDARYFGFKDKLSPGYWWKSFFVVMEPQALVIALIGIPSVWGIIGNRGFEGPIGPIGFLGMIVFGIGYYFETVGDGQLQAFKADAHNKGRYLRTGVWTHTRHPNYFGNTTVWWGIWLTAVAGNPAIWWTVIGPVVNTIMLTGVLGKAFQDKHMGVRPEYQKVMAETRGFLPLPVPKR
ncbi:DUF1295 domain-containing protein [Novosphingobium sp. 9U]|uniref:DUF1295 domain-containing protein n=1 Tax=Novosphingobium sp. 9U TaxID=2653158 RepID=UPI0012F16594|nr:DUF1295 domain-containing protein [Novosphingobium sp. 9U]VWX50158.1 Steroid 5-alpha reductase family enzyme [Novosphingobium sp. 9U]